MNWMFIALGGRTPSAAPCAMDVLRSHRRSSGVNDIDRVIHGTGDWCWSFCCRLSRKQTSCGSQRERRPDKGDLSSHLGRLEDVAHVAVQKTFKGKVPLTIVG